LTMGGQGGGGGLGGNLLTMGRIIQLSTEFV